MPKSKNYKCNTLSQSCSASKSISDSDSGSDSGSDSDSDSESESELYIYSEIKLKLLNRQQYCCANRPGKNLPNLENYQCILWRLSKNHGKFDEAGFELDNINDWENCDDISKCNDISKLQLLCPHCYSMKLNNIIKTNNDANGVNDNIYGLNEYVNKILKFKEKIMDPKQLELLGNKKLSSIANDKYGKLNLCIRSLILYFKDEIVTDKFMVDFADLFYYGDYTRLSNIILIIKWIEKEFTCNRFKIVDLIIDQNPKKIVKKMLEQIDMFQWLSKNNKKSKRKKEITLKIKGLKSVNEIKGFYMNIFKNFDDFYDYDTDTNKEDSDIILYSFFMYHQSVIDHLYIISHLDIESDNFCDLVY